MTPPLDALNGIADDIFGRWDTDMRPGKLLVALGGNLPKYDVRVTIVRVALHTFPGLLAAARALQAARAAHDKDPSNDNAESVAAWSKALDIAIDRAASVERIAA